MKTWPKDSRALEHGLNQRVGNLNQRMGPTAGQETAADRVDLKLHFKLCSLFKSPSNLQMNQGRSQVPSRWL